MENISDSYVKMSSLDLKSKVEAKLFTIQNIKNEEIKGLFDKKKAEICNGFWHKLLNRPEPSDKEIMEIISLVGSWGDHMALPETFWINYKYDTEFDVLNRLLHSCKFADEVFVSSIDLLYLR